MYLGFFRPALTPSVVGAWCHQDGDKERLRNASGVAVRDIVQFVPMR